MGLKPAPSRKSLRGEGKEAPMLSPTADIAPIWGIRRLSSLPVIPNSTGELAVMGGTRGDLQPERLGFALEIQGSDAASPSSP